MKLPRTGHRLHNDWRGNAPVEHCAIDLRCRTSHSRRTDHMSGSQPSMLPAWDLTRAGRVEEMRRPCKTAGSFASRRICQVCCSAWRSLDECFAMNGDSTQARVSERASCADGPLQLHAGTHAVKTHLLGVNPSPPPTVGRFQSGRVARLQQVAEPVGRHLSPISHLPSCALVLDTMLELSASTNLTPSP